jgi:membrane protein involved in colicin uptake
LETVEELNLTEILTALQDFMTQDGAISTEQRSFYQAFRQNLNTHEGVFRLEEEARLRAKEEARQAEEAERLRLEEEERQHQAEEARLQAELEAEAAAKQAYWEAQENLPGDEAKVVPDLPTNAETMVAEDAPSPSILPKIIGGAVVVVVLVALGTMLL